VAARHLGAHASIVTGLAQRSVRLVRGGPTDPAGTGSRFGGNALLPRDLDWPLWNGRPLSFLGQIRPDEVAPYGEYLPLSSVGLLAFFYDLEDEPWGYDPADAGCARVVPVGLDDPVVLDHPPGALGFTAHSLTATAALTVPDVWEPSLDALYDAENEALQAMSEALSARADSAPMHRMFGWPDLIQNPMQLECQLASNGVYVGSPEGYRDPRVEELTPGAQDWRLLLQIDTDDEVGWTWGDVGRIYYWIREDDLRRARFDRVWLVFQCY
jgi:uncharacterized protein YwqG